MGGPEMRTRGGPVDAPTAPRHVHPATRRRTSGAVRYRPGGTNQCGAPATSPGRRTLARGGRPAQERRRRPRCARCARSTARRPVAGGGQDESRRHRRRVTLCRACRTSAVMSLEGLRAIENRTLGSGTRDRTGQESLECSTNEKRTPARGRHEGCGLAEGGRNGPVPRREARSPTSGQRRRG